eukprot:TRINITY_DN15540_c1_g2_i1.p1 TRINITY_DN15540_c1_g2~~TRINITY_DN15540_c1_g2_i1.p1  ORF type:complete len:327 (+),score=53.70 TRINITY_DN15540_c1_g2_i1:40-981(+)
MAAFGEAMDFLRRHPKVSGCGCGAIALVILVVASLASLEYTEIGLNYSWFSSDVDTQGYGAGLYLLGPGHSFIRFPSTVQTIQFSNERGSSGGMLRSRTSDGLEVSLEVSFQYQLNVTSAYDLYHKFGTDYERIYVNMAMDLLTRVATIYNASQFFSDRQKIALGMEEELKSHFGTDGYCSIPFFQLRSVDLPKAFDDAIQDTEVKKQDIQTAQAEYGNQEVQMQTQVLQALQQAKAIALKANASAQTILLNMNAYVKQFALAQELQAESLKPLYGKLNKDEKLLLEYMSVRALRDHPAQHTVVNLPQPQPPK